MAPEISAQAAKPVLSLYANLLDSSSNQDSPPGTILRAPVVFKQNVGDDAQQDRSMGDKQQQISAGSYQPASIRGHHPTKRPQLAVNKAKQRSATQRAAPILPAASTETTDAASASSRAPSKTTLADWTAEAESNDVNGFYGEKRQRGGRKKRKKNKEEFHEPQNWDDIYDPSRPNSFEDYKHSDERLREIREWKDRLYAHRTTRLQDTDSEDSEHCSKPQMNKQFAPLTMSFAPPLTFHEGEQTKDSSAPAASVVVPHDPPREDAYARSIRLSGLGSAAGLPNDLKTSGLWPPSPEPSTEHHIFQQVRHPSPLPLAQTTSGISRAPVRYNLPTAPSDIPASEAELERALQEEDLEGQELPEVTSRSLRPGQRGFAERLMSKYGWSKGSGLGASGTGIVNPLRVQVEKQKKKPDSEGGGFVGSGGMGKIVGGKKKAGATASDTGKFGAMSDVVVLQGMTDGMDLNTEMVDGSLVQEIGEECGEKYGRVEQVYIDRSNMEKASVFVKFTSQLSALRAVNALEGRVFNGNTITAKFFDSETFEEGVF